MNRRDPWPRIRDLPEEERGPFLAYLQGRTASHLEGVPEEEQDAYYEHDYNSWKPKDTRSGKLAAIGVNGAAAKDREASPTRFSLFQCVGFRGACGLFRKPKPVTRQALIAQIRKGGAIGYRGAGGRYLIPFWQFRPGGGVLEGLPEVLRAIRTSIPGNDRITPFTFLLQANPVTDGRSPLVALRAGEIETVLTAVEAHNL